MRFASQKNFHRKIKTHVKVLTTLQDGWDICCLQEDVVVSLLIVFIFAELIDYM